MEKRKTTKANLERKRIFFIEIGFIISLALVFLGFEWKQYGKEEIQFHKEAEYKIEEDIIINTKQKEPPKPKDRKTKHQTINVVEDDVDVDDELIIDAEADDKTVIDEFKPVIVDDSEVNEKEIFKKAQVQPSFKGGEKALMKYLMKNVEYPQMARKNNIEGKVFVTFIVEPDGSITNVRILRGIGGGCNEEALKVVRNMPKWNPGKQRGKPVRVQFNLPIRFILRG